MGSDLGLNVALTTNLRNVGNFFRMAIAEDYKFAYICTDNNNNT